MSTNKTQHYQLNQWEAEDAVLRTEFNEDNQKIDGALSALSAGLEGAATVEQLTALSGALQSVQAANRLELLLDRTLTQNTEKVALDVSQLDMGSYLKLFLVVRAAVAATSAYSIWMRFNGISDSVYSSLNTVSSNSNRYTEYSLGISSGWTTRFLDFWESNGALCYGMEGLSASLDLYERSGGHCSALGMGQLETIDLYSASTSSGAGSAIKSGSTFRLYGLR